jgi:hypothetical protein
MHCAISPELSEWFLRGIHDDFEPPGVPDWWGPRRGPARRHIEGLFAHPAPAIGFKFLRESSQKNTL